MCCAKFNKYGATLAANRDAQFVHGLIINYNIYGSIAEMRGHKWIDFMRNDIAVLITCDEIHMLPDWKESKGANIEHDLALALGIKIVYA